MMGLKLHWRVAVAAGGVPESAPVIHGLFRLTLLFG
jgi:hypothetical protein